MPVPPLLGREVQVENLRQVLGGDADAGVRDANLDAAVLGWRGR